MYTDITNLNDTGQRNHSVRNSLVEYGLCQAEGILIDLIPENLHGAFPPPPPNITESQEMHGLTKVILKPKPCIGCTIILFRCIAR